MGKFSSNQPIISIISQSYYLVIAFTKLCELVLQFCSTFELLDMLFEGEALISPFSLFSPQCNAMQIDGQILDPLNPQNIFLQFKKGLDNFRWKLKSQ